jgi:hypothetical protein
MPPLDKIRRFSHPKLGIIMCVLTVYSVHPAVGDTLWDYLARYPTSVDLMDIAPADHQFFVIGARSEFLRWESDSTPPVETIVPPLQRNLLLVLNVDKREQDLVWHREYANLPDVHEVYSTAPTTDHQLCIVYGSDTRKETGINPLMVRLDRTGGSLWFKHVFPQDTDTDSEFVSGEHIANLDAIKLTATANNACLLALITRSTQFEETFRLHLIRYGEQGEIVWHKVLPTNLYGKSHLLSAHPPWRHFVVQTNVSRDAALQAMMRGQAFIPQINMIVLDSDGGVLPKIDLPNTLNDAWLYNAMATSPKSLLFVGKKGGPWLAHIHSDGHVATEHFDNNKIITSGAVTAITARGKRGYIITHDGYISVLDPKLHLQSTEAIKDMVTKSYHNPQLALEHPEHLAVDKLLPLNTAHYLLFYQYGSQLVEVNLEKQRPK